MVRLFRGKTTLLYRQAFEGIHFTIETLLPLECCLVCKINGTQSLMHSMESRSIASPQEVTNIFCETMGDGLDVSADNSVVEQPDISAVMKITMLSLVISIYAFGANRHSTICAVFSS
ncbi:hypothetical protein THZG08_100085 [Vibrio owensii]|nr:hypothetical protein THZG08_100085 [Vibrio owensii]CAH1549609.1 hypothetical protein THOA03_100086 [Vibrio owensii]